MGLIRHYESCVGLLLYKVGQHTAELWYCPAGYSIKPHSHPQEDIELMFLYGKTTFFRIKSTESTMQYYKPKWYNIFRSFSVKAGWTHWFTVGKRSLVFINFAKWKVGVVPTSASVDFKLTN